MRSAFSLLLFAVVVTSVFTQGKNPPRLEVGTSVQLADSHSQCYAIGSAYSEQEYKVLRESISKIVTPQRREEAIRFLHRKGFRVVHQKNESSEWYYIIPPSPLTVSSPMTSAYILHEMSKHAAEREERGVWWHKLSPAMQILLTKMVANANVIPASHKNYLLQNPHQVRVDVTYCYFLDVLNPDTGQLITSGPHSIYSTFFHKQADLTHSSDLFPTSLVPILEERHKMAAEGIREVRWVFSWEVDLRLIDRQLNRYLNLYVEAVESIFKEERSVYRPIFDTVLTNCRRDIADFVGKTVPLNTLPEGMRLHVEEGLLAGKQMGRHNIPSDEWHALPVRVRDDIQLSITFPQPEAPDVTITYSLSLGEPRT